MQKYKVSLIGKGTSMTVIVWANNGIDAKDIAECQYPGRTAVGVCDCPQEEDYELQARKIREDFERFKEEESDRNKKRREEEDRIREQQQAQEESRKVIEEERRNREFRESGGEEMLINSLCFGVRHIVKFFRGDYMIDDDPDNDYDD